MTPFGKVLFGQPGFRGSEEYLEFQFKFLTIIVLVGALVTGVFLVSVELGVNPIAAEHVVSMRVFTIGSLLLWLCLRGHKGRFPVLAWTYEILCMGEYLSTLVHVPSDQLRIFWFVINVPGVFLLLGHRAGWAITLLSVLIVALANPHSAAPYSVNALVTFGMGMLYLALFFQIYAARSISYFNRMQEYNGRLHRMASHDMLTDVLNARAYYEVCDQLIRVARRKGAPYAVLFVDLDHFKSINDTHGHAAGDAVLRDVAACLGRCIRQSDALGRIGGEEFSIFLPDTGLDAAKTVAEHARHSIEALMPSIGERRLRVTASIGVAGSGGGDRSMLAIQQQADQAMYVAKSRGRNRVSCFAELEPAA